MSAQNRIRQGVITVLNAQAATGAGVALDVSNYKSVNFDLSTSGSANATIKFAISNRFEQPDFSSPASSSNFYTFVQLADIQNDSAVNGNTGIVLTGTDVQRSYEVNANYVKWICPIVTAYSAGAITITADAVNDYTR